MRELQVAYVHARLDDVLGERSNRSIEVVNGQRMNGGRDALQRRAQRQRRCPRTLEEEPCGDREREKDKERVSE